MPLFEKVSMYHESQEQLVTRSVGREKAERRPHLLATSRVTLNRYVTQESLLPVPAWGQLTPVARERKLNVFII